MPLTFPSIPRKRRWPLLPALAALFAAPAMLWAAEPEPAPAPAPAPAVVDVPPAGENPEPPVDDTPGVDVENLPGAGEDTIKKDFKTTQVPDAQYNLGTQTDSWRFTMDAKAREPFSYARSVIQKIVDVVPEIRDPKNKTEQVLKQLIVELPEDYGKALAQYGKAVETMSRFNPDSLADDELNASRNFLSTCLINLDKLRKSALDYGALPESKASEEQNKIILHYVTAANTLALAAHQKLDMVNLRLKFNQEVLRQEAYKVKAIQSNYENPEWPYAAVKFAGVPSPKMVGDTVGKEGPNAWEMTITALSPKKVTVLFQHQATFDIPVTREEAPKNQ